MPYTKNPYMPRVRRDAADMVRRGFSKKEVGRRFGVGLSTVCKWVKKAQKIGFQNAQHSMLHSVFSLLKFKHAKI